MAFFFRHNDIQGNGESNGIQKLSEHHAFWQILLQEI
jgi:hypothetical protein